MSNQAFKVMDCALIAIATGEKAQNLRELRDMLKLSIPGVFIITSGEVFFILILMIRNFKTILQCGPHDNLHDSKVSEQLSIIDPNLFKDIEDLRQEVVEIIEERLSESEHVPWVKTGQEFHFIRSQIVIFDTGISYSDPEDFLDIIPKMSSGEHVFSFY